MLARASAAYPTRRPGPGACEQAPADWIAAAESVAAQLAARGRAAALARHRAVGDDPYPGHRRGRTASRTAPRSRGRTAGPTPAASELRERVRRRARCTRPTGQWVDGRYLLPMFLRVADDEPARAAATPAAGRQGLPVRLADRRARHRPEHRHRLRLLPARGRRLGRRGIAAGGRLPPAARPAGAAAGAALDGLPAAAGEIAAAARLRPDPGCLGAADSVLGALGLGVPRPGQVAYIAGTSNVIMGVAGRLLLDPDHRFLVTPLAEPGRWGLEMDLLATGSAISWLAGLLGTGDRTERPALVGAGRRGRRPRRAPRPALPEPGRAGRAVGPAAARHVRRPRARP